jgi:hypothetical protein
LRYSYRSGIAEVGSMSLAPPEQSTMTGAKKFMTPPPFPGPRNRVVSLVILFSLKEHC